MAKNTILMIGDGMGWEMARTAAIYQQIQAGNTGTSLSDFYTSGKGTGLNFQTLTGYGLVTTYGTTIAGSNGVFNNGLSALNDSNPITGESGLRPGFVFNPTFNPGTTPTGGATVSSGAVGNLVGYDPVQGGPNPWTPGTNPEYIKYSYPDSANTATTLYTGVKSYNNAIGVDIFENDLDGVLARAARLGKSTGLVTSVPIDHATPAAAAANVNRRAKYDADFPALDNILQQELRIYQPTVLLGGGHPLSALGNPLPPGVEPNTDNTYIRPSTYAELSSKPTSNIYDYTFLERGDNAAQVLANTAATIDPEKGGRLLGLYGARGQNGNLPVPSADGDYSTTGLDLFSVNTTKGLNPDTLRPLRFGETDAQFIATERNQNPTLDDLTKAALNVLGKDPDGLWLMIEGGDIDWAAHDNNIDNLIGNTLAFDKAVGSVIDWIGKNGGWDNNELIVTADHDHYLTLNNDFPALLRTKGAQALTDIDTIAESGNFWGTSTTDKYQWGNHSNRPVPVYYQGAGTDRLTTLVGQGYESYGFNIPGIAGLNDQTQIAQTMFASVTKKSAPIDFNGDGRTDVIVRNKATGQNAIALMNNTTLTQFVFTTPVIDLNWEIGGAGDFNGDYKTDVVLRNKVTGENAIALMNGTAVSQIISTPILSNPNWEIGGVGDFNNDGQSDIVFRNKVTGNNSIALMKGTSLSELVSADPVTDLNWVIGGVGDFNSDGKDDVIFRNKATGENAVALLDGTALTQVVSISILPNLNWTIGGVGDYNNDSFVDVLFRNSVTGENSIALLNNTKLTQLVSTTTIADNNWVIGA